MTTLTPKTLAPQRGTSLFGTLIAFLVLSLGVLAAARLQTELRLGAEVARQRSEAVRLAQREIEALRAFTVVATTTGQPAFDDIASRSSSVDGAARFTLTRQVDDEVALHAKRVGVRIDWADAAGNAHQVALDTVVDGSEPALGGALSLAPTGAPVKDPLARAVHIPVGAVDLGNGSSALVLPDPAGAGSGSLGGTALVFDNASGTVIARCTAPVAANLTLADLGPCDRSAGMLLSGHVRFEPGVAALPFGMALLLTDAGNAKPPFCGHAAPTLENGVAFVAFHCVVYAPAGRSTWSGRLDVVPVNWTLGSAASDLRVCRTTADLDGSGAIDANLEHPGVYTNVKGALTQQNFSIVKGTQNCTVGDAPHQP